MARIKSIAQRKHRKILKQAKGFKQARRQRVKTAKEAILHAGQYAYIGRRLRKRDMRALWIIRLSAAAKERGSSYSKLIAQLNKAKIQIDRKILSDIAIKDSKTFDKIVNFTS
ncbi:MAG: 50S ribosomal protein L20 [bacterium]